MAYVIGQEDIDAVTKVLRDKRLDRYINPQESLTRSFEECFSSKIAVKHTIALSSGTSALICGLIGMNISPGDEVLIPAHTYIATALAVLAVGAIPVLCEVDESLTICTKDIYSKVTPQTKAIIPVHMHGLPCNMLEINSFAKKYNLKVLEDVAQACGGSYQGKRLGSIGDAGSFSFNHHKILSCGEGGALVTSCTNIYQRAYLYHDGGCIYEAKYPNLGKQAFAGVNYRISEISSAILMAQLKRLDTILTTLRKEYHMLLNALNSASYIKPIPLHDFDGQCGRFLFLRFPSPMCVQSFCQSAEESNIHVTPASTPGHVHVDWLPLLDNLKKHSCPKTLDIVACTVGIPTSVTRQERELEKILDWLSTYNK